jgi:hypothetical protein
MPSLHGLANLLSDDYSVISQTSELLELSEVLSSIQLALGNVLHHDPAAMSGSLLPAPGPPNLGIRVQEGYGDAPSHGDMSAGLNFLGGQLKRKQRPQLLPPSLGITTGNPWVFLGYPDPYPSKPTPTVKGMGSHG